MCAQCVAQAMGSGTQATQSAMWRSSRLHHHTRGWPVSCTIQLGLVRKMSSNTVPTNSCAHHVHYCFISWTALEEGKTTASVLSRTHLRVTLWNVHSRGLLDVRYDGTVAPGSLGFGGGTPACVNSCNPGLPGLPRDISLRTVLPPPLPHQRNGSQCLSGKV